ncbi:hypothetical protein [Candidatus Chloroploca sp. Khr17]|uniref:hypothetical protein n=1 Tax=Candidatus Chloroploca sp. Khr17 TaxID=2496869 RepID=UPI00101BB5C8|nr:hypothetical protein [Candidatus Chloroploca sp. Khr17]
METLLLVGLVATVLMTTAWHLVTQRPQQPQIIAIQVVPAEAHGTGCLPLLFLVLFLIVVLMAG